MASRFKSLAWCVALIGAAMGAGSMALVACSSDDSGTDAGPKKDSSTTSDTGGGSDTGGSDTGGGDAGGDAKQDACAPHTLFPSPEAGPFCPFQPKLPDGGFAPPCQIGQHCCIYPADAGSPSTCNMAQQPCMNNATRDWGCDEPDDCNKDAGLTCCIQGNVIKPDNFCPNTLAFLTGVKGSTCKATCVMTDAGGEAQMCSKQSDCPGNLKCLTDNNVGKNIGVCVP